MYAAVRDHVLSVAGYDSFLAGLRDLEVDSFDLSVPRGCVVRALSAGREGETVDLGAEEGLARYVADLRREGVGLCGLLMSTDFGREDIENEIAWVVRCAEVARACGCPVIRIDAVMQGERDLPLEQRQSRFVDCMAEILGRTAGLDVDFGIENHGFQGNDPEFLDGVLEAVGSDRFGLTMDTGNFYWSGKPLDRVYEILEHFAPHAKQAHVKNINYPDYIRNMQREMGYEYGRYCCPIPDGDIDHSRVVAFLREAGYERSLCCEDESIGAFPEAERKSVLRRDMEHLKALV